MHLLCTSLLASFIIVRRKQEHASYSTAPCLKVICASLSSSASPGTSGFINQTSYHAGASEGRAQVQGTHGMTRDPESPGPRPAYASLGVPAPRRRSPTLLWRAVPRPNPHPRDARVPPRCCAPTRGLTPRGARAHSLPPRLARAQFRPLRADTVHRRQRGPTACYLLTYGLLTATRGAVARSGARRLL